MDDSLIDRDVIEELVEDVAGGDPSLLIDLFGMFRIDGPARARRIHVAAAAVDLERIEREAHSLKGSAGNLGARQVVRVAEDLQVAVRDLDPTRAESLSAELGQLLDRSLHELEDLIASYR